MKILNPVRNIKGAMQDSKICNEVKHGGNVWEAERRSHRRFDYFLDFSSNINPLGPPRGVKKVIEKGFKKIRCYPDPGYIRLREALARFFNVDYTSIFVGNGLSQIIDLVSRAFSFRNALILEPTYSEYEISLVNSSVPITYSVLRERDNFVLDERRFYMDISSKKELAIFFCNPNNPTGTLIPKAFFDRLLKKISSGKHWLIVDEAFIDFTPSGRMASLIPLIDTHPRLIVLWSLTKIFSIPGLRLGIALAGNKVIDRLQALSPPWSVNIMAQEAALASLRDKIFLEKTRYKTAIERNFLFRQLKKFNSLKVYPSEANFFLIKIFNKSITARKLGNKLFSHKILIRDCSNFYSLNKYFFRIAIKDRTSNRKLIAGLKKYLG